MAKLRPRHPVYVISKGRADFCHTANFMVEDDVKFRLVVEPQERDAYASRYGADRLIVLPFSNLGLGGIPARNFVWEHSIAEGHERHWIFDDNITAVWRAFKKTRIPCASGPAIRACEDFTDRYENIGIAGMNYTMFVAGGQPPFNTNVHVYSNLLILNEMKHRWRGRYNEDTDLCLQVLCSGLCTVSFNAFSIMKKATMTMKGGNSDELYAGDGRLKMARSLERVWPYVVGTDRRFQRPQHVVRGQWRGFDTKLKLKPGIDLSKMKPNEYGLKVARVSDAAVKGEDARRILAEGESGG